MFLLLSFACSTTNPVAPPPHEPARPPAQAPDTSRLRAPGRVVAIGDIHGDPDAARDVLQLAGLVDGTGTWTGGNAWLVQTGDITDRGPDSKGVITLLARLEKESAAAGGRVIALNGNHEVMNLLGDWRYVSPEDLAGYGGDANRKLAWSPDGHDGAWTLAHDIVAQVDGTVFAHGGVDAHWAGFGVRGLNAMAHAAMRKMGPPEVLGSDGPLWNRTFLLDEPVTACPQLAKALLALGADRMVVGHTTQDDGRVAARCTGQLYGLDTGLSTHYGRHLAALEIQGDSVRPIYPPSSP